MRTASRYFTTFEASTFLGVSLPTVVNWIKAGRLKAHRTPGGHRRIARDELSSFIRRHGMPMPPELATEGEAARLLLLGEKAGFEALVSMLKRLGFEHELASAPFAAGLAVGRFRPDLVVIDLAAERFSGERVIEELRAREQTRHLPVVGLLGAREEKPPRSGPGAALDLVLTRPLDAALFRQKVDALLRAKRAA